MSRILSFALICASLLSINISFGASAGEDQTWGQHKELFIEGTITDSKGKIWNIRFMPGSKNITKDAGTAWKDAGETIANLVDGEFYQDWVIEEFVDGLEFAFVDSWGDFWFSGIDEDFDQVLKVWNEEGTFGGGIGKALAWTWFGIKVIGRTVSAPVGTAGGIVYSVVVPVGAVAMQPVGAVFYSVVGGITVPGVLYVWNGTAWVATYFSDVPKKEGWFVVLDNDVPSEEIPGRDEEARKPIVIDRDGFNAIVSGIVLEQLTDEQKAPLRKKIAELERQINELQKQKSELTNKLQENPDWKKMEMILADCFEKNVELSEDSKSIYLNDEKLKSLISDYLQTLGLDASDEMVDEIVKRLKTQIRSLLSPPRDTGAMPVMPELD